jgi:hypothetical protein
MTSRKGVGFQSVRTNITQDCVAAILILFSGDHAAAAQLRDDEAATCSDGGCCTRHTRSHPVFVTEVATGSRVRWVPLSTLLS